MTSRMKRFGKIENLAIENVKAITGVVINAGGYVGIGERYMLIDPSTIVVNDQNGPWKFFVDTSKEALENAPDLIVAQNDALMTSSCAQLRLKKTRPHNDG